MVSKKWIFIICIGITFVLVHCRSVQKGRKETVPSWAKRAVWYQIFPERFANGDEANDPTLRDIEGGWPHFQPDQWQVHPWTSDWYKLQPWEETYGKDFNWCAGLRRYGGDLQGVLDRLDYLQDLGINAIYFNPLFESPSLHKYDATLYHHIDNNFGPDPDGDRKIWEREDPADPETWEWTEADQLFLCLIKECHRRGIKVIIDGVFNHVGNTFWAFQHVVKHQQNSPYKDWFIIEQWDDPETSENEFKYEGWMGVRELPEIREDANGLVSGPREHIHAVVKRWMDPNGDGDPSDGIDGWRLDVAEKVNIRFWRTFRRWVKAVNPDAYLTGEVWWDDWRNNKMFNAAPWLQGDVFDAVMNYRVVQAIKQFVIDDVEKITMEQYIGKLQKIYDDYPWDHVLVCQNLMDSHDVDRIGSQIVNPDRWYDHDANPASNPDYDVRKPNDKELLKPRLITVIQMTLPGAPMVYYGGETGMWGGDDPDCRKPKVWPELTYETETVHPAGKSRPADKVRFDSDIFNWHQKLITIRKENPVLALGEIDFFLRDNEEKVLGYRRQWQDEILYVIVNNNPISNTVEWNSECFDLNDTSFVDLISNHAFRFSKMGDTIELDPYQGVIMRAAKQAGVKGKVVHHEDFSSQWVDQRHVDVWLPPGYEDDGKARYPVLYMHDGQNLFDPKLSYIGVDWGMDETMIRLIGEKKIQGAIVVGVWNTPKRGAEYMPQKPAKQALEQKKLEEWFLDEGMLLSDNYLRFLVEELKPFIDSMYRTRSEVEHTFIMGSSLGGLISAYALCEYPDVFGGAGCVSTHWPAGNGIVVEYLRKTLPDPSTHKIYFDYGTETLDAQYEPYQVRVDEIMHQAGYKRNENWITKKYVGHEHSERAWRRRMDLPLIFFLAKEN